MRCKQSFLGKQLPERLRCPHPDVAIDGMGDAVAVWRRYDGSDFIVQAAAHPEGGAWTEPDDLSASGQDGTSPVVAANEAGAAVAMWHRSDGAKLRVQAAARQPEGEWPKPTTFGRGRKRRLRRGRARRGR